MSRVEVVLIVVLSLAALAAVAYPLLRRSPRISRARERGIELRLGRYRESLRAGTVCARCLAASPPGSRFCAGCGRRLGEEE